MSLCDTSHLRLRADNVHVIQCIPCSAICFRSTNSAIILLPQQLHRARPKECTNRQQQDDVTRCSVAHLQPQCRLPCCQGTVASTHAPYPTSIAWCCPCIKHPKLQKTWPKSWVVDLTQVVPAMCEYWAWPVTRWLHSSTASSAFEALGRPGQLQRRRHRNVSLHLAIFDQFV
jgi:hypothetical protein